MSASGHAFIIPRAYNWSVHRPSLASRSVPPPHCWRETGAAPNCEDKGKMRGAEKPSKKDERLEQRGFVRM